MILLLFGFWLILNGRWTGEIAIVGAVVCGLVYAFMAAFMGFSPRKEWAIIRRGAGILRYFAFLLKEVFSSAWATIRLIWSPKVVVQPEVTSFRTKLRTAISTAITITTAVITGGK